MSGSRRKALKRLFRKLHGRDPETRETAAGRVILPGTVNGFRRFKRAQARG